MDNANIEVFIDRFARGSYQADIIRGNEALSGASLQGRARQYAGRYMASRRALCERLTEANAAAVVTRNKRGKYELVVGDRALSLRTFGIQSGAYLGLPVYRVVR